jgi:glycosyltransferase involved in cell wall biosynthesis
MKIGIDISIANINQAGTGVYVNSLVDALKQINTGDEYHIFDLGRPRDMAAPKTLLSRMEILYRDIVWMHGLLPWQAHQAGVDILHMPSKVIPVFLPCPTVVTIFDMTVFRTPHTFWHRSYSRVLVPLAARHSSMIFTLSQHSKSDIVKLLKVTPDKVVVTYPAASPRFRPISEREIAETRRRYDLDSFILSVCTLEPRKNIIRLLRALALLRQGGFPYQLIHAGPRGWMFEDTLSEVDRLGLQDSVRFLGRVPLDDLIRLYNAASLFVYPSLYEGFGIPILEAMACGCPVVASNASSLPEVVGEAGIMVDPYNVQHLADALQRVLEDKPLAWQMRQRGLEWARQFSWQRCAQETVAVYHQVLEQRAVVP